jgi:AI-2 transport protein TqsA
VFGVLVFFLNYVPNIGSGIATVVPMPLVIMHPEATIPWVLACLLIPMAIQIAVGNVLEPKVMGDRMDLHPVVVLMALIFWGVIWGIVGALLAVPITACIKLVLERFDLTVPVARALAGRIGEPQSMHVEPEPSGAA